MCLSYANNKIARLHSITNVDGQPVLFILARFFFLPVLKLYFSSGCWFLVKYYLALPLCAETVVGFIVEFVMFVTISCTNMEVPFKVTMVYQMNQVNMLRIRHKTVWTESSL